MEIKEVQITDTDGNIYVSVNNKKYDNSCEKCCFFEEQKEKWMQGCEYASNLCEFKHYKKLRKSKKMETR